MSNAAYGALKLGLMSDDSSVPTGRLKRLRHLVGMTARVSAGLALDGAKKLMGSEAAPTTAAAMRVIETLGTLKGAAMKAGQTLSLFSSDLPPEAQAVLGKLFSQAPAVPFAQLVEVIEAELGKPLSALYAEVDPTPLAGASLGQVHRATLHSGEQVVVKVQYPGVHAALAEDFKNVRSLVKTLGVASALLDSREYVEELEREISLELDYRRELSTLEQFRGYLARWPDLVVPRAYPALSAARVLTLQRLEGPTLNAWAEGAAARSAQERFQVAERLVRAVYGPFLLHRVVHGDTHPGNYIVLPQGQLGILDYGCAKTLSERFWRAHVLALRMALTGQREDLVQSLKDSGFQVNIPDDRAEALLQELADVVMAPVRGPYDFSDDSMLKQLNALKLRHPLDLLRVRPPAEALLFFRALGGIRQTLYRLKAAGDFRPFFRETLAALPAP